MYNLGEVISITIKYLNLSRAFYVRYFIQVISFLHSNSPSSWYYFAHFTDKLRDIE